MRFCLAVFALSLVVPSTAAVLLHETFESMSVGTVAGQQSLTGTAAPATWSRTGAGTSDIRANQPPSDKVLRLTGNSNIGYTSLGLSEYQLSIGETWSISADMSVQGSLTGAGDPLDNGIALQHSIRGTLTLGGNVSTTSIQAGFIRVAVGSADYGPIFSGSVSLARCQTSPTEWDVHTMDTWSRFTITQTRINQTDSVVRYFRNGVQLKARYAIGSGPLEFQDAQLLMRNATTVLAPRILSKSSGGIGGGSFTTDYDNVVIESVPEPGTVAALLFGLGTFARSRGRRRN